MPRPTISSRFFIQILKKAKHGTIQVSFPDGKTDFFGQGDLVASLQINNWVAIENLLNKGDLGLAEEILDGGIVVDNIAKLVEWACLNDQDLERALHGTWFGTVLYQIKHLLKQNSKKQAKKNIMAHYDLGNDFYKLWLDSSMTYSSAIFKSPDESLEQAQQNKYDRLIEQLNIKSTDHLLEIGCGWGGFFSRAVEKTGCKVTAVMNSPSQAKYNAQLISQKGMANYIELKEIDYRDITGKFDKIVSIEMIEAVGEKYWDSYFAKIASSLRSKGEAIIQGITIKDELFYSYRKKTDFIQSYIFPGGMLMANEVFKQQSFKNSMHLADQYEFGISYAETLKIWQNNFNAVKKELNNIGFDDKFMRMWNLYLGYCEGAFRAGRTNVGQYLIKNKT